MPRSTYPMHLAASAAALLLLSACNGGSSSDSSDSSGSAGAPTGPSQQQRIDAATATARDNSACSSLTPFYWEIGDQAQTLASGSGGSGSAAPPKATTSMLIASASKWLFSTYLVERNAGVLSDTQIKFLHFQSGYTNFDACSFLSSVDSCLGEAGRQGGTNGDYVAATDGHFFYDGGHMQKLASSVGLGADHDAALASELKTQLGSDIVLSYIEPQLAGGGSSTPASYGQFLRNLLSGRYPHMLSLLGSHAVCTHTNSSDCPSALYSPVNQSRPPVPPASSPNDISDEAWHYSLGHWIEDDPTEGDGAFSSPGRFGFYPWIDSSKTYYGLIARFDAIHTGLFDPKNAAYITSAHCGRLIRKAWLSGTAQ